MQSALFEEYELLAAGCTAKIRCSKVYGVRPARITALLAAKQAGYLLGNLDICLLAHESELEACFMRTADSTSNKNKIMGRCPSTPPSRPQRIHGRRGRPAPARAASVSSHPPPPVAEEA